MNIWKIERKQLLFGGKGLVLCLALFCCLPLFAQQPETTAESDAEPFSGEDQGDLFVRGGPAAAYASHVTVITERDLRDWAVRNVAEALSQITASYVTAGRIDPELQNRSGSIRGITPSGTRILVDGIPALRNASGTIDLTNLLLENVKKIEIIRGPSSALYGGDNMGGSINIITRRAPETTGVDLQADFGTGQAYDYRLGIGSRWDWFSVLVTAEHQEQEGFKLSGDFHRRPNEPGNIRNHAQRRNDRYFGKMNFELGPYANLKVQGDFNRMERNIPVDQDLEDALYYEFPEWQQGSGSIFLHVDSKKWFRADANAHAGIADQKLDVFADLEDDEGLYDQTRHAEQFGGDLTAYLDFGKWSLIKMRAAYLQEKLHLEGTMQNGESYATAVSSYGLEWEMNPVSQLLLLAGASFDIFEGFTNDRGITEDDLFTLNPVGSITYVPLPELSVTLSFARKVRFASIRELYMDQTASPDLKEETGNLYEAIVRYSYGEFIQLAASGFWMDVQRIVRPGIPGTEEENIFGEGDYRYQGGEIELASSPAKGLSMRLRYTLVVSEDLWDEAYSDEVYFVPEHRAFGEIRYTFFFGLGLGWWSEFVSDQQYASDSGDQTLDAYSLHNARISYRYKKNFEVYAIGTNLFDAYYEKTRHFAQPGRSFHGGVQLRF